MAMSIAKFPFARTLEGFEYEAQPSPDPGQIRELATCRWVANGDTLLLLGPPGVGKTHLAVALGLTLLGRVPALVSLAFGLVMLDALEGVAHPPIGARPAPRRRSSPRPGSPRPR